MHLSSIDVVPEPGASSVGTTGNATTTTVRPGPETAVHFESVRPLLFGIAYRTLGRAADAEDVVQDVWVRWQGADRARVRDRVAFLVTITTRVALNAATSARARHEVSVGGWGPERGLVSVDPVGEAERGESLACAVRLMMERLSPVERAVYVLREAFEYPFREIADMLGLSEANARQLAVRARKRLAEPRHSPVGPAERDRLLEAFLEAARSGDMAHLIDLLRELGPPPHPGRSPRATVRSATVDGASAASDGGRPG
ncbi:sigma-70 family RNA polymerase sigma factor [Streptomyces sp. BE147]|uniref:sigma-70 family RNA polymerase sigma factor n=1 Tax=Streptomyces sp. BE147 TaxID=3002524 RepID=UPI002E788364|nr:sigma-70 family RNA polymerase sigma factor [Streptomyces sp. BE147]MEE1736006.1 sigma-70 family RNA polymerase sigma factor [Streptomyces sp. BE147]